MSFHEKFFFGKQNCQKRKSGELHDDVIWQKILHFSNKIVEFNNIRIVALIAECIVLFSIIFISFIDSLDNSRLCDRRFDFAYLSIIQQIKMRKRSNARL